MLSPITLIIADDHYVFRYGLKNLAAAEDEIEILATADDGETLVNLVVRQQPDVILIGARLPGGVEACRIVSERFSETGIIVLQQAGDEGISIEMIAAGADCTLDRKMRMPEVVQCIKKLHHGNDDDNDKPDALLNGIEKFDLTKDEKTVLQLLSLEMDSVEIGKELFKSEHTINHIRKKLLQKCGVKSTVGLVMFAVKYGIVKV